MALFATLPNELQVLVCKHFFDYKFTDPKINIVYGSYGFVDIPTFEVLNARKSARMSKVFLQAHTKSVAPCIKFEYQLACAKELQKLTAYHNSGSLPPHGIDDDRAGVSICRG